MTGSFSYRHWRELQAAAYTVVSLGLIAAGLWAIAVVGACTAMEAYRVQWPLVGAGLALVATAVGVTLVRTAQTMSVTTVQVGDAEVTVIEPDAAPRSFSYAELKSVRFLSEELGGFHRAAESTRIIDIDTLAGGGLRVDIHNSGWGGIRQALARYLPDERLGQLP